MALKKHLGYIIPTRRGFVGPKDEKDLEARRKRDELMNQAHEERQRKRMTIIETLVTLARDADDLDKGDDLLEAAKQVYLRRYVWKSST